MGYKDDFTYGSEDASRQREITRRERQRDEEAYLAMGWTEKQKKMFKEIEERGMSDGPANNDQSTKEVSKKDG